MIKEIHKFNFILRQVIYDLKTGLIFRPAILTICFAVLGITVVTIEKNLESLQDLTSWLPWGFHGEGGAAQALLGTIAGSIMTVSSIVYSIFTMSLTLASMQFSPRILTMFMRDELNQTVLGFFIGTFTYCLLVMRTICTESEPFVPNFSVSIAIFLALVSLGMLMYFIHYMSRFIQANYIIDHIAKDTEIVMKSIFPCNDKHIPDKEYEKAEIPEKSASVLAVRTGYIQLIDDCELGNIAGKYGIKIFVHYGVGEFVAKNTHFLSIYPPEKVTEEIKKWCLEAFDIGPIRTMQQDISFGIRQIVDIALKAISPAVNDPTTATTCIEYLESIVTYMGRVNIKPWNILDSNTGEIIVSIPRDGFKEISNLAFTQIRQYGKSDMAVSMSIMRALRDISESTENIDYRKHLLHHGELIDKVTKDYFTEEERKNLIKIKEEMRKFIFI